MRDEGKFSVIAEITRRMKQAKVAEFGDSPDEGDCDLMGFCACIRGGRQLFAVYHGEGPMAPRQAAAWSAMMLSCDEIFMISDAYYKTIPAQEDDVTALLPRSPEQQEEEFWRNHPEVGAGMLNAAWERGEREGINECIVINRYAMVGPPITAQYMYTRQGRKLTWGKIFTSQDAAWSGGGIDDLVKEGFRQRRQIQPQIDEAIRKVHADMAKQDFPPDERQYWTDRGLASFLSTKSSVFLVHYLGDIPAKGLPDVVFKDGEEVTDRSRL